MGLFIGTKAELAASRKPKGRSKGGKAFDKAFAAARKGGKTAFAFGGKSYSTKLAGGGTANVKTAGAVVKKPGQKQQPFKNAPKPGPAKAGVKPQLRQASGLPAKAPTPTANPNRPPATAPRPTPRPDSANAGVKPVSKAATVVSGSPTANLSSQQMRYLETARAKVAAGKHPTLPAANRPPANVGNRPATPLPKLPPPPALRGRPTMYGRGGSTGGTGGNGAQAVAPTIENVSAKARSLAPGSPTGPRGSQVTSSFGQRTSKLLNPPVGATTKVARLELRSAADKTDRLKPKAVAAVKPPAPSKERFGRDKTRTRMGGATLGIWRRDR